VSILENWTRLQAEVKEHTDKKISLIAVSKTKPLEIIEEALDAGISVFGENRIQEAEQKFRPLFEKGKQFELHHIGPVQSGTLKKLFGLFQYTHGVGSISTLESLSKQSEKSKIPLAFFLQANLTEESTKHGFKRKELLEILPKISSFETEYFRFHGLMTMGPTDEDPALTRSVFSEAYQIKKDYCPRAQLSMGMSGDYPIALEEGADYLRIGSKIFGLR
jgi:PLP dependent protein